MKIVGQAEAEHRSEVMREQEDKRVAVGRVTVPGHSQQGTSGSTVTPWIGQLWPAASYTIHGSSSSSLNTAMVRKNTIQGGGSANCRD